MIDTSALDEKPVLPGARIRLVPLEPRHAADYHAATLDPEIRRLTGSHHDFTPQEIEAWCAVSATQPGRLDLAIEDRESGRFLGDLSLKDVDPHNAHATLRILLVAGATDRGLGTEAIRLLLDHAFDRVRLHRVRLEVFAFNDRARRAYERCGFTVEGRMRQALRWDGAWHDVLVMAALRTERTDGARAPR
ncbi:GNAT family N-acetyltransferase [Streptomyces benahoarensis]|uniref:GNAT family N-acetyltransferase n=1 Tax=Streptomyces benahoarensis TaxID=2595054 RepID=A0A553Z6D3_9ACTN|nr:GNAT family protein [Streptomyces benahoarensis]TSB25614.1 GNAT family N-acetyltransferase [Streptomyces benahoarensis]TSB36995.1 GNAT family N-acetyltransferase [Streptomyces benahoarensis]